MKNKRFVIICSVLALITTISLIITYILNNEKEVEIHIDDLHNKSFKHTVIDDFTESSEEFIFKSDSGTKRIIIKTNDDSVDDVNTESEFYYTVNDNLIYIKQADLTTSYKYKNNCIYETKNPDIKYCIQKDA